MPVSTGAEMTEYIAMIAKYGLHDDIPHDERQDLKDAIGVLKN